MVSVCAWCERFLGLKENEQVTVTHGICDPCVARQSWEEDPPVLVVSSKRSDLAPVLSELLRGLPEIKVVVDRRTQALPVRQGLERRRSLDAAVV